MFRPLALGSLLVVTGCGSAPPPPAKAPATATIASAPTKRAASLDLQKRWVVAPDAPLAAYLDLAALQGTALWNSFVPKLIESATKDAAPADRACVVATLAAAREAAFGDVSRGMVAVIHLDPTQTEPQACFLARMPDAKQTVVPGANDAFELGEGLIAFEKGFVHVGDRDSVIAALAQKSTPWPSALSLAEGEQAAFALKGDLVDGHGSLLASSTLFQIAFEGKAKDEKTAASLEAEARSLKNDGGRNPIAAMLGQHVEFSRTGTDVKLGFALKEPVEQQTTDLARVVDLGEAMLNDYLGASKLVEVQEGLKSVIRSYIVDFEKDDPKIPRAKRKLASYPAVPKAVPRGTAATLSAADWKSWDRLKVAFPASRYQYEIKAAKDGMSAEITARGDLNGDGKTSLFRVQVKLEDGKLGIDPDVEEVAPLE